MRKSKEETKQRKHAYDIQYSREHITKRVIDFNDGSQDDMMALEWLDSKPNKSRYMKGLILDDRGKAGE